MHPSSFGTLTRLTVYQCISFGESNIFLRSPYTSIVDDVLTQFTALETLRFEFILQQFLNLNPSTFTDGGWSHLPSVVTQPGACPRLREVAIRVIIRASDTPLVYGNSEDGIVDRTVKQCKEDADWVAGAFAESVYPAAFAVLIHQRPEVNLSFVTEVSVGSDVWDPVRRGADL
jgi:hypothetical protein